MKSARPFFGQLLLRCRAMWAAARGQSIMAHLGGPLGHVSAPASSSRRQQPADSRSGRLLGRERNGDIIPRKTLRKTHRSQRSFSYRNTGARFRPQHAVNLAGLRSLDRAAHFAQRLHVRSYAPGETT